MIDSNTPKEPNVSKSDELSKKIAKGIPVVVNPKLICAVLVICPNEYDLLNASSDLSYMMFEQSFMNSVIMNVGRVYREFAASEYNMDDLVQEISINVWKNAAGQIITRFRSAYERNIESGMKAPKDFYADAKAVTKHYSEMSYRSGDKKRYTNLHILSMPPAISCIETEELFKYPAVVRAIAEVCAFLSVCVAHAIYDGIDSYYRTKRGVSADQILTDDELIDMIASTEFDPDRIIEDVDNNVYIVDDDDIVDKEDTMRILKVFFGGKANPVRGLTALGNIVFSAEYKRNKHAEQVLKEEQKRAYRKKNTEKKVDAESYFNDDDSIKGNCKNKEYYDEIFIRRGFTCRRLLDYVVTGLYSFFQLSFPHSTYIYVLEKLEAVDALESAVVSLFPAEYRSLTGAEAHVKFIERLNYVYKEKLAAAKGMAGK